MATFLDLLRSALSRRSVRRPRRLALEALQERWTPAVTASFSAGVLTVLGDAQANTIAISRNAGGALLVNNGAVAITGGNATVANTTKIQVYGNHGNDSITLNESSGALPAAVLYGGQGNDQLTGGSGADRLYGEAGHDGLRGMGGADQLYGGGNNDTLTAGAGNDHVDGQWGNDRLIWNHGDGTDLNEGGDGVDTVEVNGSNLTETFSIAPNSGRVRFDRVDPTPFSIDIGTSENLVLKASGGWDIVNANGALASLIQLTVDGGAGNDTLRGGNGHDTLLGGDGHDTIDGNGGNDTVDAGAGDDVLQWDPGDGSDTIEAGAGADRLIFNGSEWAETITISASGGNARVVRNVGNTSLDLDDLERIDVQALSGPDTIVVQDLTTTDVAAVNLDLTAAGAGDQRIDNVVVWGTAGHDIITPSATSTGVEITGLRALVAIRGAEATDRLLARGLAGDDVIDAALLGAASLLFTADGDDGNDVLMGGNGDDTLRGGGGDDVLIGNAGTDVLDGGAGDNILLQ
jgi:Ca2+-binding RTX toxin-like protein